MRIKNSKNLINLVLEKNRVGKRARGKKDKSRRRKKDKKFSAGNKIPATREKIKKLSKELKTWRRACMDCFAENEKARRKVSKHEEKLIKCSRNLTLSRELLKVKEKSRKHKFRNGDGK